MKELTYARRSRPQPVKGPTAKARAKKLRMAQAQISPVRSKVVIRAEGCCERCRRWVGDCGHAHHRIPRSLGGKWTLENIEYLCSDCHKHAHRTGTL